MSRNRVIGAVPVIHDEDGRILLLAMAARDCMGRQRNSLPSSTSNADGVSDANGIACDATVFSAEGVACRRWEILAW